MKKSDRALWTSLAVVAAVVVGVIAANRFLHPGEKAEFVARTTADDLAALRDFDTIRVQGDFALHVVQQPDFSVRYTPWHPVQGRFNAHVKDRTLVLEGFGNRLDGHLSQVEVGLPALSLLSAAGATRVQVSGMRATPLVLRIARSPLVRLTDNHVELTLTLAGVEKLQIDAASQKQATSFEIRGPTRIETLP